MNNAYYSPFYPSGASTGTKGTTSPIIGNSGLDEIRKRVAGVVTDVKFAANTPSADHVAWTSGDITYVYGGTTQTYSITAGDATWTTGSLAIWWDRSTHTFHTGDLDDVIEDLNSVILAIYKGDINLTVTFGQVITDGENIRAGSVTADKMNVSSLDAITATIGLLRTATTGARTEIEDNQIRVYDSTGALRVRLGIW